MGNKSTIGVVEETGASLEDPEITARATKRNLLRTTNPRQMEVVEEEERFPAIPLDDPLLSRQDRWIRFQVDSSNIRYLARQLPHFGVEQFEFTPQRQAIQYVAGLQAAKVASTAHFIMFDSRYPDSWEPPYVYDYPDYGNNNPQPTVLNTPEAIAAEIAATRMNLPPPYDFEDVMMRHARLQITTVSIK
jgi:hypothetical protein